MNILIVNLHSSRNAGDDLLTQVTVQQLLTSFVHPELTLSMNDPESYKGSGTAVGSFMTWFRQQHDNISWHHLLIFPFFLLESLGFVLLYRLFGLAVLKLAPSRHRPLLAAYFTADLVISSAGNFLYSSGRLGLTFVVSIYIMLYAWLAGKPLYTMPQTIGPLHHNWERLLVKWAMNRMRLAFVRDTISLAELDQLGLAHHRYQVVPDLAFAYPECPREAGISALQLYGLEYPSTRPRLGVTLMNWAAQNLSFTNQSGYEAAIAHTIRTFMTQHNAQVVLFSQVCGPTFIEDDRIPAQRVKEQLADCGVDVVFIAQELTTAELKAAYGLMDVFIGTRLHSNIFAVSEGVPAVMIEYRYKTRGVMQMLDLEAWVIDIQTVDEAHLNTRFQQLWAEQDVVRAHIHARLPAIMAAASEVGQTIASDYFAQEKK